MTIRLHRGDLPDLSALHGFGGDRHRDHGPRSAAATGFAWCSCRTATAPPTSCRSPGGHTDAPNLKKLLADPVGDRRFSISRASISPCCLQCARRDAAAGLLHQDRLAPRPHLYRPARLEGSGARGAQRRSVEAAAVVATGARRRSTEAQLAYAASDVLHLHALKDKLDAMLAREGREELAKACFEFLPTPGEARSRRLGRTRTFSRILKRYSALARSYSWAF